MRLFVTVNVILFPFATGVVKQLAFDVMITETTSLFDKPLEEYVEEFAPIIFEPFNVH